MHAPPEEYLLITGPLSRTLDLLRNCLSDGQDGGCKQHGQTATISLKVLLVPRLAVCSRDLHWHWINYTLLCDTMEVSMLRLAWLPIPQHVFQPALTGRLELISRKIVSSEQEQRLSWWADFTKTVSRELNARSYRDFVKNIALLGATSAKFAKSVAKKMGSNMRPRYIQFRDIHDRDISGLHCISIANALEILQSCTKPSICTLYNIFMMRLEPINDLEICPHLSIPAVHKGPIFYFTCSKVISFADLNTDCMCFLSTRKLNTNTPFRN